MAKTYKAPRKVYIDGKAGKKQFKAMFPDDTLASVIIHQHEEKTRLAKARKRERRWKLAQHVAIDSRPLNGRY